MPSDVVIDGARCLERIRRLYSIWRVGKTVHKKEKQDSSVRIMMEMMLQPMTMMHYIRPMLL
jgi:hypothetical protein